VISLNEAFLKGFNKDNKDPTKLMEGWWLDEDRPFKQGQWLIPTQEFKTPYMMLIAMIRRLYGEEKSSHFHMEWLPMAYTIVKIRHVFNWADILTFYICRNIKNITGMKKPFFYMYAYLIDAICSSMQFPDFRWSWDQDQLQYMFIVPTSMEHKLKKCFYDICDLFLSPLYTIVFEFPRYKLSNEAMEG
jgi:hypothetical protein